MAASFAPAVSAAEPPQPPYLVFPSGEDHVIVPDNALKMYEDAPLEDQVEAVVQLLINGPSPIQKELHGAEAIFPAGTGLHSVKVSESGVAEILLDLPQSYLAEIRQGRTAFEKLVRDLDYSLFDLAVYGFTLKARDSETGKFLPLGYFEPEPEPFPELFIPDTVEPSGDKNVEPVDKQFGQIAVGRPSGSLSNRVVHMNAGHGWTYRSSNNGWWGLQRAFVHNNIEDMSNADLVHQYVHAYLQNAGATVFNVREPDPNPHMVIVDNDDGAPDYVETGEWQTSSLAGFANGHAPYTRTNTTSQAENPFSFGTNRIVRCTVGAPTATATWIPTIPESGFYNVYVSHSAFTNRAPEAHYRIYHAGGYTDYFLDQRRYRFTWVFIGRYYFDEGRNPESGQVVLSNSSTSDDHFVSADAVRFGGGMGLIDRSGIGTSGFRRYDEEAVYHMQFSGAPTTVHQRNATNDESAGWSGRPRFADWLRSASTAYGAPAQQHVALANHTNATAAGTARGIISYLYSGYEGTIHDRYRRAIHDQIVLNLQNGYGGDFVVNSNPLRSGQYGEVNPNNSGGIPVFLGEWLFHDNARDMAVYHDPKFRRMLARGIYQGIVKFFESEYGGSGVLLPEPPRNLRVTAESSSSVRLQWMAPPTGPATGNAGPATGYIVHQSTHGRGFPPGNSVTGTSTVIDGLEPGKTYYFYVTATNAGGVSFPTETLAVKLPTSESTPRVLVVNGFDKTDIATRVRTPHTGSTLYRQFVEEMNSYDYIVEHGRAIDASNRVVAFDSAEHDAVDANQISLLDYDAVIWIGGLQAEVSTADPTDDTALKTTTRNNLANYISNGGRLFMSGASIAWDLNRLNQAGFATNNLRMNYVQQGSNLTEVVPHPSSIFAGLGNIRFGDGPGVPYRVHEPDILQVAGGSQEAFLYGAGSGANVVDSFDSMGGWRHPTFSGQSNADPDSTFQIVSSPVYSGSGSGQLHYIWGSGGDFIRLYNSALTEFTAASDFSIWVRGDGSGNRVRICLRNSDNTLVVNEWTTLDFTDWRQIVWEDIPNNPGTFWPTPGPGSISGSTMRFDSIHLDKVTAQNSGTIYFDEAVSTVPEDTTPDGPTAGIQYAGDSRVIYLGFPFETIAGEDKRTQIMGRTLDFLLETDEPGPQPSGWLVQ
ncbi:MAG: fibronectin type III domain-containing protein [Candidatus Sumerlaeia bacterium]|nr:fibronectin type III domain-containing protein [Candidatus Sumerlaeia bacterium]